MPIYDYLYDLDKEELRSYSDNYPSNPFLEALNLPDQKEKLNEILFTNVIGNKMNEEKTVVQINVEENSEKQKDSFWEHGYPEDYDSLLGDHGLKMGTGDGTVPSFSAQNIASDEEIIVDCNHNKLPSETADLVYQTLTGYLPAGEIPFHETGSIFVLFVFSPIDIKVIAPDGTEMGVGTDYNYENGAFYSKYLLENGEEVEFLTIPNPIDGEYQIIAQGTGAGNYKIEATQISQNEETGEVTESAAVIEGETQEGEETRHKIKTENNEITLIKEKQPATIDSILKDIDNYYQQGLIKTKKDKKILTRAVKNLKHIQLFLEKLPSYQVFSPKAKEKLTQILQERFNRYVDIIINYISQRPDQFIAPEVKESLTESLGEVKY